MLCAIAARREPATFHHEDDEVVAIDPLRPMAPVHVLLFPRRHAPDLPALLAVDAAVVAQVTTVADRLAERFGLRARGYRLVWNVGPDTAQRIGHPHLHLLGGRPLSRQLA